MTFAVVNHTERENCITQGWPGHFRLSICCSGNLGWKKGDVTFAGASHRLAPRSPQGSPGRSCPVPLLWVETAEQGDTCSGHRGAASLGQPCFSCLLLSLGLTGAVVGVRNLNSRRSPVGGTSAASAPKYLVVTVPCRSTCARTRASGPSSATSAGTASPPRATCRCTSRGTRRSTPTSR